MQEPNTPIIEESTPGEALSAIEQTELMQQIMGMMSSRRSKHSTARALRAIAKNKKRKNKRKSS